MQLSLDTAMERTFSVGEFGQLLTDVLNHTFAHDVWIQGEVRDMNRAQSGHVYFTLVDPAPEPGRRPDAALPVVLFEVVVRSDRATKHSRLRPPMRSARRYVVARHPGCTRKRTARTKLSSMESRKLPWQKV